MSAKTQTPNAAKGDFFSARGQKCPPQLATVMRHWPAKTHTKIPTFRQSYTDSLSVACPPHKNTQDLGVSRSTLPSLPNGP
jgi:hypothetical protein